MSEVFSILYTILTSGVFAVTVGFLLGLIPKSIDSRARKQKALSALRCEIEYCGEVAKRYLEKNRDTKTLGSDETQLPLRYPILAFQNAFPTLLDSKNLNVNIIYDLTDYYCHLAALNNSLNLLESEHYNKKNKNMIFNTTKELAHKCSLSNPDVQNLLILLDKM